MPQVFHRSFNTIVPAAVLGLAVLVVLLIGAGYQFYRSPYATGAEAPRLQPVPFSHQHHVGVLEFDCRYCHTSVEKSWFAGIPATEICMNCHSQIWVGSQMLAPVRESYRTGTPLVWHRLHNLQQFVYFDHSIHVRKGIGCTTCHGRIDRMPLTYQASPLTMSWCVQCHRHPEKYVRPRDRVFDVTWEPPSDQVQRGRELVAEYGIRAPDVLTSCSACHR